MRNIRLTYIHTHVLLLIEPNIEQNISIDRILVMLVNNEEPLLLCCKNALYCQRISIFLDFSIQTEQTEQMALDSYQPNETNFKRIFSPILSPIFCLYKSVDFTATNAFQSKVSFNNLSKFEIFQW